MSVQTESYQIFTRYSGSGTNPQSKPRRVTVVTGIDAARAYCRVQNADRTRAQILKGFFYEFANKNWYDEAHGG